MGFNLKKGLEATTEITVEQNHTAERFGSGGIKVLATPMMIGLMENASMKAVEKDLGDDYSTVGIHVDIKHLSATPIGLKVTAKARLMEIKDKKLIFEVEAYDEKKKIGEGQHTRYIINKEDFMNRIK